MNGIHFQMINLLLLNLHFHQYSPLPYLSLHKTHKITQKQEIVRNYVIFDEIEFEHEGINKITIGRQYDDPDSEANASWCYVDKYNSEGFKNTLYLVNINDERIVNDITDETADSFGVSKALASKPLIPKYHPFLKESIVHHT